LNWILVASAIIVELATGLAYLLPTIPNTYGPHPTLGVLLVVAGLVAILALLDAFLEETK